jgi:hypothetical protein
MFCFVQLLHFIGLMNEFHSNLARNVIWLTFNLVSLPTIVQDLEPSIWMKEEINGGEDRVVTSHLPFSVVLPKLPLLFHIFLSQEHWEFYMNCICIIK